MRGREVCDGVLMALLVDRRGNNERVERLKIRTRCEPCAIAQLDLVPPLANVRCRPFGNFPRLPFGRSINNQDVHDIPPTTRSHVGRADRGAGYNRLSAGPRPHGGEADDNRPCSELLRVDHYVDKSFATSMRQSPVAMDEMFELFDNELLITDNAFHHVANRNYTN